MPDLVLDYHRLKTPIDHLDLSITRAKLEYPTVNVSFAYLACINKVKYSSLRTMGSCILCYDTFTDKSVLAFIQPVDRCEVNGRLRDYNNYYLCGVQIPLSTQDFFIDKVSGTATNIATEAVDLDGKGRAVRLSISGSTIKGMRYEGTSVIDPLSLPTPNTTLSGTDTTFASGYYGFMTCYSATSNNGMASSSGAVLLAPASPLPPALAIVETEVEYGERITPKLSRNVIDNKDLDAVTWGTFELHADKAPTAIIIITGDNPYKSGAILRQIELAKGKNLRVFSPPRDYREAVELYNQLERDYSHWLAGKDNFAYQTLGWEILDWMQNIDFYHGELLDHMTHYNQLKQVPDKEITNRLNELIDKLSRETTLTDEREKHIAKAKEVLKKGW